MDHFSKPETKNRPQVLLAAAMSLDGKIATVSGDSRFSSPADLKSLHRLRSRVDAVMIGIRTEIIDNPILSVRYVTGKNPTRIVVDSSARIPPHSKILRSKNASVIVAASWNAPQSRIIRLERAGAVVIRCGKSRVNLKALLRLLYRRGIRRLLLEGGGTLNWSMLKEGLVDQVRITISPILVGGQSATTLVEGAGVSKISEGFRLRTSKVNRNGDGITLSYKVITPGRH